MEPNNSDTDADVRKWWFFNCGLPRSEIVYFSQVFLIYIVVIAALINISTGNCDSKIWIALLTAHIGYLLPNPKMKRK
jgi:hypothetical protein